jgi:hypothetical protein
MCIVLVAAVACTDPAEKQRIADSTAIVAVRAESATAAVVAARPPSALWDAERMSERMVRSGVAPRRIEPTPEVPAFFATAASSAAFLVGRGGELRVYIFADSTARQRATDALDPRTASPRGERSVWPIDGLGALLITNNNLAAVLFGGNSALHERVQLGIEAGLSGQ